MANIKNELNNIKSALYGKDVRGSIHDGIDAINKEVESTTGRQVDLENTFDQLVINAGNSNAEIVDARVKNDGTSYSKLGDRLDAVDSQLADIENNKADKVFSSVKDFGAIGNGVTDDTKAIQECLNNANIIKFESKEYRITSKIVVGANKIIDLNGSTIIYDSTAWNAIFNIQGSNVKITNGTLINKEGANCYMGIGCNVNGSDENRLYNMTFENLTMRNMVVWTPNPVNGLGSGIYANFTNNMTIRNVKVYDVQGFGISFGRCNDSVVDNCYVENVYGHAYSFSGEDVLSKNCKLINSVGKNTGYAGIDLEGGIDCSISNNTFENIGYYDDNITENFLQSAIVYATLGTNNAIVSDNIIKNVKWGGILIPTLANDRPHKVVIKGNIIENAIKYGVNIGYNGNRENKNHWWIVSDNVICNSNVGINGGYLLYNAIIDSNFVDTCEIGVSGYFVCSNISNNRVHNFTSNGIKLIWFDDGNISNNTLIGDSKTQSKIFGINIDKSAGAIYRTNICGNNVKVNKEAQDVGIRVYANKGSEDLLISNNTVNLNNNYYAYGMWLKNTILRTCIQNSIGGIYDPSNDSWS